MTHPLREPGAERRPVLITGGCGFIGCNIADALAARGDAVLVLDSLAREGSRENALWLKSRHGNRVDITTGDVRDVEVVRSAVAGASAVIHLAAQVAVTTSLDHPLDDFEINARGTLNVLEAVRLRNPNAAVLFASTNKVYGRVLDRHQVRRESKRYVPIEPGFQAGVDEAAALDFHSPYGCSKGAADQYVRDYARVFGLRTGVLRMSCIYGPRQFGTEDQGWIAHFLLQAIRDEAITIYGDGYQVRDALHVEDAARAWLAVLDNIDAVCGGVFNLGGGSENVVSLRELLDMMTALHRAPPTILYSEWRPGDQPWYVSDTAALQRCLGWTPRIGLRDGLRSLDQWLISRFAPAGRAAVAAEARL
jgi:CDP-paratose 2-epimerase